MTKLGKSEALSMLVFRFPWFRVAIWGLILTPLFMQAAYFPSYGPLQSDDYYGVIDRLSDGETLAHDLETWFSSRIMHHRVTVPALIWGVNLWLFDGNNQPTAFLSFVFLVGIFLILVSQLKESLPYPSTAFWPVVATVSILVFIPANATNLGVSFQGIHYYLCNLFAVLSFLILVRAWRFGLVLIAILGVLGALTFSSSIAIWPALLIGAVLLRCRKREMAMLLVCGAGALMIWTGGRMPGTGSYSVSLDPGLILRYLGVFIGSTFTRDVETARFLGWFGLVLALVSPTVALRNRRLDRAEVFWFMLQAYVFGSALLAALGRAEKYGESQAMSDRYAHFPALFWLGLIVSISLVVVPRGATYSDRSRMVTAFQWVLVVVIAALTYQTGFGIMRYLANRGARQVVTDLALRLSAHDELLIRDTVCHKPQSFIEKIEVLRNLRHVPFNRDVPELDWKVIPNEMVQTEPHPEIVGGLTEIKSSENSIWVRVRGWASHPHHRIEEVVFIDGGGSQQSEVLLGLPHGRVAGKIGGAAAKIAGWEGFVRFAPGQESWTPYARLSSDSKYYPLAPTRESRAVLAEFSKARRAKKSPDDPSPPEG